MLKPLLTATLIALPFGAWSQTAPEPARTAVYDHILPGLRALTDSARRLADLTQEECQADSDRMRSVWGAAFDDWIEVSHLRFGPMETDNRGFALAFWPDSRGTTPKTLTRLFADHDPIITTPEGMASVSVAARGFYAMEYLLFDPDYQQDTGYACALIRASSADIAATTEAIFADWSGSYAQLMLTPGSDYSPYHSIDEVNQELFKALAAGLQFTSDMRLGRPLGTFERPRPSRAEAHRSGRAQQHVILSLSALKDLAVILSAGDPTLQTDVSAAFDVAIDQASSLEDPDLSGVSDPAKRLKIEILQQTIDLIREQQLANIGAKLGVAAGFNALDGD